jgi:acetylornithine/N-succinyldiaminopimelate aminotransferase
MSTSTLIESFQRFVVPTYARFPIALAHGKGTRVWDLEGKEYLDFGSGIAVSSLGHAHPKLIEAISRQAQSLIHTSNLYYTESQGHLAEKFVKLIGPGKCFFCNSGAEANEALFKLARKFGHDSGRYEILTTLNSFHGRTLAGIAATGQDKVKKGFEPAVDGFRHVPFNDLHAMRNAVSEKTVAILIEGIQGEGGVLPASLDYLLGLRQLCNERRLLLFMDAVQCGSFRTGRFQSYQRILESSPHMSFMPDAISMAKGIAGGIPMGAIWTASQYADVLGQGSHGTTFGGTPLACSAALSVLEVIEAEKLADNARNLGDYLQSRLKSLNSSLIREVRGLGLILGIELQHEIPSLTIEGKTPASLFVTKLHDQGLLTIPAGNHTIRFLPPLNVTRSECDEAVDKFQKALSTLK